jgi:NAD(P)-dependent dehydrogenase (short-subunit alcohol dehydrogenase family)
MAESILDKFRLNGKTAVVTGGNTGLGFDMASALAQAGADIVLTSRDIRRAQEAAGRIAQDYGVGALGLEMDQQDYESVQKMADSAFAFRNRIDILVNNAGGGAGLSDGDFAGRDAGVMAGMVAINLTGVLYCCRAVSGYMMRQGHGRIVNVASVAGMIGRDRAIYKENGRNQQPVEYAAAKGGVIGLGRDLAAYLAPYGICVNTLSPGLFNKGELSAGFDRDACKKIPLGRTGRLNRDIMGPVLFLCSEAAEYVTGHNLVVDGGFTVYK